MSKILKSTFVEKKPFVISNRSNVTIESERLVANAAEEAERVANEKREELLLKAREEVEQQKLVAEREVEQLLQQAKEQAIEIREQMRAEGYEEGKDAGFNDGYQAGISAAQNEMNELVLQTSKKAEELLNFAENSARETILAAEGQIIEMVLQIARKVISEKISQDDNVIIDAVESVLEKVKGQEAVVVKLSPFSFDTVILQKDILQRKIGQENKVQFVVEENLEKGDCLIETTNGVVDALIETKLNIIEKAVRELL